MTTNKTTLAVLCLVAVLAVAIVPAAAGAQETADNSTDSEGADLLVEQPSYVENDLVRQSENGLPVYIVEGSPIHLYPEEFEHANVSDFGIRGDAGSVQYDDEFERYTLSVDETGSYRVWWDVDERVTVERNNETTVATETTRYEGVIRVDGQVDVAVRETGKFEKLQQDAGKWDDLNGTLSEMRNADYIAHRVDRPDDNEQLLQDSLAAYKTTRSPLHLLQGGFTAVFILLFTSVGGIAALIVLKLPDLIALYRTRGETHKRRVADKLDGDVADRQEELDLERRLQSLSNWDWQDVPSVTDHEAAELRDSVATTPLGGLVGLMDRFAPDRMFADRVRAMGQAGYVAQDLDVEGDTATDGVAALQLVHVDSVLGPDETVADRDDLQEITDPSESLLDQISLEDPALYEFDPRTADIEPAEFADSDGTMSLPELIDEFDFSQWGFESDERIGEILVEYIEMIRRHSVVEEDGSFDQDRLIAERLLQLFQFGDDYGDLPLADLYTQHFETALETFDRDEELAQWLDEHRSGHDHHQAGD